MIRVAVVDKHTIFRRGVVASLQDERLFTVVVDAAENGLSAEADVAIASARSARRDRFRCPLVVCTASPGNLTVLDGNSVVAILPGNTLTPEQLAASARAAAAGLDVEVHGARASTDLFDERSRTVLRLLAEGADTREISRALRYSPRTIKALISAIQHELGSRNRAHAVALAIRRGLI